MKWKGIKITFPTFPIQSLYGNFPTLATWKIQIWNIFDLLGLGEWMTELTGYWTQYLAWTTTGKYIGLPPPTPPTPPPNLLISFKIPNLLAIPSFLGDIFLWILGWAGAVFEWSAKSLTYILLTPSTWLINRLSAGVQSYISTIYDISKPLGIFAPVIMTLAIGAMILAMFTFALGVFKILEKVIP